MPAHASILQPVVVILLALVTAAWVTLLGRILRRRRFRAAARRAHRRSANAVPDLPALPALPGQRQTAPERETVELTPAEEDAFAGLVRRLDRP
ncbi:hypothetical protein ABZX30_06185 [Streptomyces sp. NPDC004542]|uniref:hypothetical protein n=1 Tax=Streptomyces sp. NPDC004542 TaxID=3154281 RepID=UPI0033B76B54